MLTIFSGMGGFCTLLSLPHLLITTMLDIDSKSDVSDASVSHAPVVTPSSSESHSDVSVHISSVHSECLSSSQVVEAAKGVFVSSASLTSREASESISLEYDIGKLQYSGVNIEGLH